MHTRNKKQIAKSFEIVYHQDYKKMNQHQHIHRRCYNQGNIHIVNLMIPWLIDEMTYTNLKFKLGQDDSSFFRLQARIRSIYTGIYRFLLIITCPSVNYSRLFLIFSQMPSKLRGPGQGITGWRRAALMARLIAELWSFVECGPST